MKLPELCPVEMIGTLLDLTPRRIQQLSLAGVIPRTAHGKYELVPSVQGCIKFLKAADLGGDARADKRRLLRWGVLGRHYGRGDRSMDAP
jgi:hypothetical protein